MGGRGGRASTVRAAPAQAQPEGVPANTAAILARVDQLVAQDTATGYLEAHEGNFADSLLDPESIAISEYTSSSTLFNAISRGQSTSDYLPSDIAEARRHLPRIDDGIDGAVTDRDIVVFRGFRYDRMAQRVDEGPNAAIGMRYSDKAHLSTSTDYGTARDFAHGETGVVGRFLIPKGYKGAAPVRRISTYQEENEILLKRNTKWVAIHSGQDGNRRVVTFIPEGYKG
jgi:hypothetical protein